MAAVTSDFSSLSPALRHPSPCTCAECSARRDALAQRLRADRLQQRVAELEDELRREQLRTAREQYARLVVETRYHVMRGDRVAWATAVSEKNDVALPAVERSEIEEAYVPTTETV